MNLNLKSVIAGHGRDFARFALSSSCIFPLSLNAAVTVLVDNSAPLQKMDGFGATHISLVFGTRDNLTAGQRARALKAIYGDVGLNLGNTEGNLLESPGDYSQRGNDNADASAFEWKGYQTEWADNMKSKLIDPAKPLGFTDFSLAQKISVRWASPWLNTLKSLDYNGYLAECAEQVVAGAIYHRDKLGITSPYLWLFNEPLDGNTELQGTTADMVNIIKAAGARLRQEGFDRTRFVVPNSETVAGSLAQATAILSDSQARAYVGVIGYHCYPYGSAYASVPRILAASGQGSPDAGEIAKRKELGNLARQYGLPLWMTEVSHSEVAYNSFDGLRGRAIHIHDEFLYAGASAYFGMNNLWDETAQQEHFGNGNLFDESDTFALIQNSKDTVHITSIGYAVGHYARWIKKGAILLTAISDDPKVQVSAFRDDSKGRLVLVVVNNNASARTLNVKMKGLTFTTSQTPKGEQSTASGYWKNMVPEAPAADDTWNVSVAGNSVTSLGAAVSGPVTIAPKPRMLRSEAAIRFPDAVNANGRHFEYRGLNSGRVPILIQKAP